MVHLRQAKELTGERSHPWMGHHEAQLTTVTHSHGHQGAQGHFTLKEQAQEAVG